MRRVTIATAALLAVSASAALAQPPAPTRPGHEIGVGDSLPRSNQASNISNADSKSAIAPTLPPSSLGANATTQDYLRAARASLVAGQTGATQQSLEMAETRALDRSVPIGTTGQQDPAKLVAMIRDARHALGSGDKQHAIRIIDQALAG